MRALILVAITVATYAGVVSAEPNNPIVVINNYGSYYRGTFPRKGAWLGLYCKDARCELRNADVHITSSSKENIIGEKEKTDELRVDENPLALFYGVQLKPGSVTTWFSVEKPMYESSHNEELQKLGRWQISWGPMPLTISRVKLPDYGGFRYFVSDGKIKQFMFATDYEGHYGGDTTPFVHWIGDLDRDGVIDLLLSIPDDNCGFDERLYLSSFAGKRELIRKAAQISGQRPACGC